ncbi:MAG: ABC transporter permease [Magnetococcales bacterium]|nr:ABC transporter permease [Magnetococcales bacterium]
MIRNKGSWWDRFRGARPSRGGKPRGGAARPTPTGHVNAPTPVFRVGGGFHRRAMRRAWRQFHEGSLSHWITVMVIALALTIYGAFALLLSNANTAMEGWRVDNTVTIFLKKQEDGKQAERVKKRLEDVAGIGSPVVSSPEQGMGRLKELLGTEAGVLDGLEENPLPYAVEFQLLEPDPAKAAALTSGIAQWREVEAVSFDRQWADRLAAVVTVVRYAGMALSALLLSAVALIISNTIKLTILARREEVEVMRFMGATNSFIKIPFIYEGVLQGVLGSFLALGLTSGLFLGARQVALELGRAFGLSLPMHFLPPLELGLMMGLGIGLGFLGSMISLSRFLEV